ncbi:hypothetical protein GIB67_037125, partial [Kingdonia uniflora]
MDQIRNENDIESEGLLMGRNEMRRDGTGVPERNSMTREPLLQEKVNTTSQIALIGANVCHIESLDYEYYKAFLAYAGGNVILATASAALCAYIAPAAAGSGIPEVKAYLNGVDAHAILSPSTLLVK